MRCYFGDCVHEALEGSWRCHFHRHRLKCSVAECRNQVYARGLCVRHGGKPRCQVDACDTNARQRCIRHGGGSHCRADNCLKYARTNGLCTRHSRAVMTLPWQSKPLPAEPLPAVSTMPMQTDDWIDCAILADLCHLSG
ncbi:hypothetical protein SPRG_10740 [Saprolegnia parasitica CBS 223.65]|uniref:Uncharacterized protein n=1 Tax=Saprolegnia parasitica (strain CBS 223.65) TaxID=695850 RepID=A0A067BZ38_SAPPC|nr:hypothetical protein SPRG_10740 [Saprolegnia parasitica CBS 223.65]KDO23548.1 hypothetical protein SPRG_10740 [Saprolegnia parasitica CBS 223.65]|eukprot:XP_012205698.1 hypothetical protein SPRG_10740 [Saprolegnia parasitica CBS 223.65]